MRDCRSPSPGCVAQTQPQDGVSSACGVRRPGYCQVSPIPRTCATGIPGSDRSLGFAARPKGRARRKCAVWLLRPDRTRRWNSAVVSNDDQAAGKRPWPKEPTQAGGPGTDTAVDLDSQFQVRIWTQNIYGSRGRFSHRWIAVILYPTTAIQLSFNSSVVMCQN